MVFSSFVFLFAYLPIVLGLYFLCPKKIRNLVLFIASLIFYAWGEPIYVTIMLFSTVFDYVNGRLIERFQKQNRPKAAKATLIVDLIGNLAILGFFKYADFMIGSFNSVTGLAVPLLHIALPIGISFYTFQTMSYTIDVYRKIVPAQKNIINFGAYVTLFPQLIAGPIVQYKTVAKDLDDNKLSVTDFGEGAYRFMIGMGKKILIANQVGALWNTISGLQEMTVATAWLGAIAYSLQIYFDFSGYSDMAIGLGRMFGFHFLENFDHPYVSKSITEFWRRWHISLSSWFREYVYIPLGGNRKGMPRQVLNLAIVWLLTGFWHGANWNFVLWGVYYGVLLILEKLFLLKWIQKLPVALQHVYSLFLVIIGWAIFAQTDFTLMGQHLKAMFGIGVSFVNADFFYFLSCNAVILVIAIICSLEWKKALEKVRVHFPIVAKVVWMVLLFALCMAFLVGDSYNPFLYFRF